MTNQNQPTATSNKEEKTRPPKTRPRTTHEQHLLNCAIPPDWGAVGVLASAEAERPTL